MAYNNMRYIRNNNNTIQAIFPQQAIPARKAIEAIEPERAIQPIYGARSVEAQQRTYNRVRNQTDTFLSNYNDPTELNSYIDALTNQEAVSKRFGEVWGGISTTSGTVSLLSFAGAIIAEAIGVIAAPFTGGASIAAAQAVAAPLAKVGAIAAIPSIPAAVDVTVEKGIKPILAGKPEEALLNTFMNLGETMDFAANPIKGLVMEGPEGFIKGIGIGSEGRVNYDYDTGFFLTDMLLETISDPMNWIDFGTSMGLKSTIKPVAETASRTLVNNTVDTVNKIFAKSVGEIASEGTERITKQMTSTTSRVAREWAKASANSFNNEARRLARRSGVVYDTLNLTEKTEWQQLAKQSILNKGRGEIQRSLVQALRKELPNATASDIDLILKQAGKNSALKQSTQNVVDQISNITFDTLSSDVIKGLASIQRYSNDFQRFMTKGAMLSSGYGLGVEAAKYGWQGISAWANNLTLNRLKSAKVFDNKKGIDIKQWQSAKNIWNATYKYVRDMTGNISQRNPNTFYVATMEQFNRDRQLVSQIMQNNASPVQKAGQLTAQFQDLYACDFNEYIAHIKNINELENGVYTDYLNYLENTVGLLGAQGMSKSLGSSIKTSSNLFNPKDLSTIKIMQKIQNAVKEKNGKITLTDNFYVLTMNNETVTSQLITDPIIGTVLTKLNSSESYGALLDKITGDLNSLQPEVASQISDAVRSIKNTAASYANTTNFYNEIAGLPLPDIDEINIDSFKRYIIDQVLKHDAKTVTERLAEFDSITMPALINGIETLLSDTGFRFNNHPEFVDQIAGAYRRFLIAQQDAGIELVTSTIDTNFTKSINDLVTYLPQYANELQELTLAGKQIKGILYFQKKQNDNLLKYIIGDYNTIFEVTNTRQLADVGLALRTVALKKDLDMFDMVPDLVNNGGTVMSMGQLGKSLNHLIDKFKQYNVYFNDEKTKLINEVYAEFRKQFIDNPDYVDTLQIPAFRYLKYTDDPIAQFAQLVEFNKMSKDQITAQQFKNIVAKFSIGKDKTLYNNLMNPSSLMVTDFALDPMAISAWVAKKRLNESTINGINAYRNLGLASKKIANDFQAMREVLSTNKVDRPKMLQQERYLKAAEPINNMFDYFEKLYDDLFDNELATQEIEYLRETLLNFPELNDKYSNLVDTLEAYWRGEKSFRQDEKQYVKVGTLPDGIPAVDEFTPFWEQIKKMDVDIQNTIKEYNDRVAHGLEESTKQLEYKNITPWDPIRKQQELNKLIRQATDANAKGALYNLFNLSPEEFKNELAYRRRIVSFEESDVSDKQLNAMFNRFNKGNKQISSTQEVDVYLSENGWYSVHDKKRHRYWYVLDGATNKNGKPLHPETYQKVNMSGRQVYLNDNPILRTPKKREFNEFKMVDDFINDKNNPGITKTLNQLNDSLETLTGSNLGDSQGEILTQDSLRKIYDEYMPQEVKDLLPEIDEWTDKQFFDAYIFNESILGNANSKADLSMYSSNMIINARNAITQAQAYLKPKNEYVNSVFDSQLSLSSPNSIWEQFSDEDLLEALRLNPDYKLVVLADDKKYGMKVREILPTSIEAIKKAKELGGWVIPLQTYKDMYNVVNHRLGSTGMARLWSRIIYTFKAGYLMRLGAWARNYIDTNLKTNLELGSERSAYMAQAHKILNDVNKMKDFITKREHDGILKSEAIKQYFTEGQAKYLTYEQYLELYRDFLSNPIAGNIMGDLYAPDGGDIWNTITHVTGKIVDWGNKTEEVNRLATYLFELDQGLDYTSALAKVAHIHFDYGFKSKAEQLAEMVFPFVTFSLRNYNYWIEMIEKHPWILRNYVHLMKPHWDFKDYTPEELARDYRVQNQILYGQLKLAEFNDKVITFKANPSIQDAIQMFSDPINNVYEKLAAPISYPIDELTGEYNNELNLIPIAGPMIQSVQQMIKTGSPIPSAIGVQQTPRRTGRAARVKFSNPNLSGTDEYTDNTYRTPRYRNNVIYDSYSVKGIKQYRVNLYPVVDIAHEVRMRYSTNVYNRIKNRIKTDMYQSIRYRIRLDTNRFR